MQKNVHEEICDSKSELEVIGGLKYEELRAKNQTLFTSVQHSRESLHDVLNVKELAKAVRAQATQLGSYIFLYGLFFKQFKWFYRR